MRANDAVSGVLIIIVAAAMMLYTRTFPSMPGQNYGPDLFPLLIGTGMCGCGLVLVVRGMRSGQALFELGPWAQDRNRVINLVLVPAALVFYVLASDALGFVIVSLIIMSVLLLRFGTSWALTAVVAPVATLVIHTLFAKILLVPLPWGILLPIAW